MIDDINDVVIVRHGRLDQPAPIFIDEGIDEVLGLLDDDDEDSEKSEFDINFDFLEEGIDELKDPKGL